LFELTHLLSQRGLRHIKLFGCARDTASLDNSNKVTKLTKIDDDSSY